LAKLLGDDAQLDLEKTINLKSVCGITFSRDIKRRRFNTDISNSAVVRIALMYAPLDPLQGGSRRELEEFWLFRVRDARTHYQQAAEQRQRMVEELNQKLIPYTDGSFAIARARRAESTALADWGRVLSIYTDLLVKGKIPPPEDGDRPYF
jgi:hypothetical protein